MKEEFKGGRVVRSGLALTLVGTLMVPSTAAFASPQVEAFAAVQAESAFTPVEGKSYSLAVEWLQASSDTASMMAQYFSSLATATYQGGAYTVGLTANASGKEAGVSLQSDGADLPYVDNEDGTRTFTVTTAKLDTLTLQVSAPGMPFSPSARAVFQLDTIEEIDDVQSYEADYSLYFKGELGDRYKKSFSDKVKVTAANGAYTIELTANSLGEGNTLGDITYLGKKVPKTVNEDGSATYSIPVSSITDTYDITFGYTVSIPNRGTMTNLHPFQLVVGEAAPAVSSVDRTSLTAQIVKAEAVEQGEKTDEAFAALQEAISTAEKAAANENIPQAGIDAVTAQLNDAIETFNTSADASDPTPTPSEETVTTADGFKLVAGKEYTLPVAFINATTGAESTAASFMEASAKVVYADGAYSVTVTPNSQGAQFLTAMMYEGKAAVRNDDGSFTISGVSAINKDIMVSVTMPAGTVDMGIRLDTSSLPTASGDPVTPDPVTPSGNEDSSNTATTDTTGQKAEQGFQVGHTYQVPISWLKHDSTEESMAAQYFGDTALVRPQSDGTFKVSFSATSEGDSHIVKLTYNSAELTKSGTQYTVSIPKADSDTVVPISMTIKEMEQLGGGAQTADMHLKLSQATDLGTGQESVVASSTKQLTKTGDSVAGVTGVAALAVLAAGAAGAASVARRRGKQQ